MRNVAERINVISILIAAVSALVAIFSVYFTYGQLAVAVDQQVAATKLEDLRFAGRISVELDEPNHLIYVSNYSDLPLVDATLWTLGLVAGADDGDKLDTIRIRLMGLGACRTMTFSVDTLIKAAAESAYSNAEPPTSADEPYLTFEAPSGSWYTISETTVYSPRNHDHIDSMEAARVSEPATILPDTVLEGDISEQRTGEVLSSLGPTQLVTSPFAHGNVELTSNSCSGPGR